MADLAANGLVATLVALIFGYLSGSVPFGLLLTRLAGTADIRAIGSGNIGATNVLRTGRRDLAAATLALDALKGVLPVLIAMYWGLVPAVVAGLGAFLGHLFPVWLRFMGGKGVATFIGVVGALWWPGVFVFVLCWLGLAYLMRYSSLAALAASLLVVVVRLTADMLGGGAPGLVTIAFVAMTAMLWWQHRANIRRLLHGSEGRIGQKG